MSLKPVGSKNTSLTHQQKALWGLLLLTLAATAYVALNDADDNFNNSVAPKLSSVSNATTPVVAHAHLIKSAVANTSDVTPSFIAMRPFISSQPKELFFVDALPAAVSSSAISLPSNTKLSAPEPPFSYVGKLLGDGSYIVFLATVERNFPVKLHDVIDKEWRIDAIKPPIMQLTYLPLKTKKTLDIGAVN